MVRKVLAFIGLFFHFFIFQCYSQPQADTLFIEIEPSMVQQAEIEELNLEKTYYAIDLMLKEDYHKKYKKITSNNSGHFLAITYKGEILGGDLPTLHAEIPNGNFPIGKFNKKEDAKKVIQRITAEDQ